MVRSCLIPLLCAALAGPALAIAPDTLLLLPGEQLRPSSDGEQPRFGTSMAYTTYLGGRLLVGTPGEDGTLGDNLGAVVQHRLVAGSWERVVQFLAPSSFRQANAGFGEAVAVNGEWAMVGAPYEDVDGEVDAGAVYFFRYNPGNGYYQYHSRSAGSIVQAGARFGSAVAIGGGRAAGGQPGYDQNSQTIDTGRVQMFRFEFDTWYIDGGMLATTPDGSESFGATLFLQDMPGAQLDRLFIGAPTETVNNQAVAGRVYYFRHDGTDPAGWEFREGMSWAPSELLDWYGSALAANGSYLFIGARGRTKPGAAAKGGAVQVQKLDAQGFYQPLRELYPDFAQSGARFGWSLALTSTFPPRIIIGAPGHDRSTQFPPATYEDAGRVYVFDPVLTLDYDWLEVNTLHIAGTPGTEDALGSSVAISGYNTPGGATPYGFAGAPGRFAGIVDAGRVQVYVGDVIFEDGFGGVQ